MRSNGLCDDGGCNRREVSVLSHGMCGESATSKSGEFSGGVAGGERVTAAARLCGQKEAAASQPVRTCVGLLNLSSPKLGAHTGCVRLASRRRGSTSKWLF